MAGVRTDPLTQAEIGHYHSEGYLAPLQLISEQAAAGLRSAMTGHLDGQVNSERYELTDPVVVRRTDAADGGPAYEYDESQASEQPHTLPFLFNMWKWDERFRQVAHDPVIAGIARQLLGAEKVLLMEDNGIIKNPRAKNVPWHQDYSYWPLAEATTAVTVWIALGRITPANGGMQVAPGTQRTSEHLPVGFARAEAFMTDRGLPEIPQDPEADGHQVISYDLHAGQGGFHHPMVWHGSPPNEAGEPRYAFILRYVAAGSVWLGHERMPYDDIGCPVGGRLTEDHFPLVETAF
jgi:hypothetical protein